MGSAFAPSAANLYMDRFEQTYILNAQFNPYYEHLSCFYRYIDNIFCVYDDPDTYPAFQVWLNQLHPAIKFTFSGDKDHVNFLDTSVFSTQCDTLAVKPYRKIIDKNSYLHYKSFHPKPLRNSIPYGQFTRIRRNSSFINDYVSQSSAMKKDFLKCSYPAQLVHDAATRADGVEQIDLLRYKEKDLESFKWITAALDFTPLVSKIKHIIKQHWHLVKDLPGCDNPPRWGLRRTKTMKDILVRSDIREHQQRIPVVLGHHRCGFCSCCAQVWETREIALPSKGFHTSLNFFSLCSTRMCVYLVVCKCEVLCGFHTAQA